MQDEREPWQQLQRWWKTPAAQVLLELECAFLAKALSRCVGSQWVLLAGEHFAPLTQLSAFGDVVRIDPVSVCFSAFPRNIDVLVIPHYLGFSVHAADLLNSLHTQLRPHGRILLTGYTAPSWLGIQRFFGAASLRDLPTQYHGLLALKKLLRHANFSIESQIKFAPFRLGSRSHRGEEALLSSFWGNIYCLCATPTQVILTIRQPAWKRVSSMQHAALNSNASSEYMQMISCQRDRSDHEG